MDMNLITQRIDQLMSVSLSEEDLKKYLQSVLIILIDLLRHLEGDKFVLGFLQGAITGIEAGDAPVMGMKKVVSH